MVIIDIRKEKIAKKKEKKKTENLRNCIRAPDNTE